MTPGGSKGKGRLKFLYPNFSRAIASAISDVPGPIPLPCGATIANEGLGTPHQHLIVDRSRAHGGSESQNSDTCQPLTLLPATTLIDDVKERAAPSAASALTKHPLERLLVSVINEPPLYPFRVPLLLSSAASIRIDEVGHLVLQAAP